jgi:hypothetical protein
MIPNSGIRLISSEGKASVVFILTVVISFIAMNIVVGIVD